MYQFLQTLRFLFRLVLADQVALSELQVTGTDPPEQMELPPFLVPSQQREEKQDLAELFQMGRKLGLAITHQEDPPSAILASRTEDGSMALVEKAELIQIFRVVPAV
jgi:hypothetical protein